MHNVVEGMNQSFKITDEMSAKPNQKIYVSVNAMLNHSSLCTQDFQSNLPRDLVLMPLYVKDGVGHYIAILTELQKVAHHMTIGQFQHKCHT
jgi:hypothetical protein